MTGRVRGNRQAVAFTLCVLGFAACNTYNDSILTHTLDPSLPAENAGTSGHSSGAGAGAGGKFATAGVGAVADGGVDDAAAGAGGTAEGGEAGDGTGGYAGGLAGGASGSAGSGGAPITAGAGGLVNVAGAASGSLELIDDFEDGDAVVIPIHGRNGPWYTFADATAGGKLSPFTVSALTGTNAHDDSTAAVHLTASGFTDWGAGVGADLVNVAAKKVAYDVSAYKGVHFYARVATGASTALKLLVTTTYSDPSGGICSDALPTTVPSKRCSDHLYFPKTIKTTWAAYDVLFSDLIQQGFGLPQATLDPKSVYSFQFTMPARLTPVDLWLDDVSFIVK